MISAVVHTYNEEKNIARCLSSLNFVDEIVLIDMDSRDKTREIAKEYKAKIFSHPYTGFVEPARNFGMGRARGDWILIVDADEEIPKTLARFLSFEVKQPKADFYRIPRQNIIFGKAVRHAGWWPDYQIRFFKKGKVSWTEKIHGIPLTKGIGLDLEPYENLSIVHYNYQTIEQFVERLNRYTSVAAKELFLDNVRFKASLLFEAPTREFITRFFTREGYKDGIHGLALSFLQGFSELVTYLKLWELDNFKEEKITLSEVEKLLHEEQRQKTYWIYNTLLAQPHGFVKDLIWRLKRKLTHG